MRTGQRRCVRLLGLGRGRRLNWSQRIGKALDSATTYLARPELVRLKMLGVPRSLVLALDQPWLRELGIRTVLDVGANTGQFALAAHLVFPHATIHAFEPLADCFEVLTARASRFGRIHPLALALGEEQSKVRLMRNDYTPSSSMLPLGEWHASAFPYARSVRPVTVEMDRLDSIADRLALTDPVLVKIDVQGYEDRVLRGGHDTVSRAKVVLIETSFVALYEGQLLHAEISELMKSWGFAYAGALDQLQDPRTGRVLSVDSIFLRAP